MALQVRHRYIVARLNEAFELNDEDAVEELIRRENIITKLNAFFKADGPSRIFFFCERFETPAVVEEPSLGTLSADTRTPQRARLQRGSSARGSTRSFSPPQIEPPKLLRAEDSTGPDGAGNDLFALHFSDGKDLASLPPKLLGKTVYFMKKPQEEAGKTRDLDPLKSADGLLIFGTVTAPLQSLETMLRSLYVPMLKEQPLKALSSTWGLSAGEHRTEFMSATNAFVRNVQENIKSLQGGLELRQPLFEDEESLSKMEKAAGYVELLEEWCEAIESYLSDAGDRSMWETSDSGPETELEYWRRRTQRLTSITDQLKTQRCKSVIVLLTSVVNKLHQEPDNKQPQQQQQQMTHSSSHHNHGGHLAHHHHSLIAAAAATDLILATTMLPPSSAAAAPPPTTTVVNRQAILSLMRRWRQIDVAITKAANEAKDNSKFLGTLERFLEPLRPGRPGSPGSIMDSIPALLNALKMVHTISRFFNTTERMTKLFMKISNAMIRACKLALLGGGENYYSDEEEEAGGGHSLWKVPTGTLLETLESCVQLNEFYQDQYRGTKDKLLTMPKNRQFDFNELQIFGKFDLFCRRLLKLIDMFSTIEQFHALAEHRLEGMEPLLVVFEQIIEQFKTKRHDLLDCHSNKFDRDYVEFNVRIGELEASLQRFINRSFESITSIEQSLQLLRKYQSILHRENLRADLESKFMVIFHNYGLELSAVQEAYEAQKHSPLCPRNMPPVAGNIMWARQLLRRIEQPMANFAGNPVVLASKESKRIVRAYNKVAKTLVAFEFLWYEAWTKSVEAAKAGLRATLIVRHPVSKKLFVNFDAQVLQLIREAKCLARIGVDIPEAARMVLAQEEHFKASYNELKYALAEYDRVCGMIQPTTAAALAPHLLSLECKLRPGMVTLTWTSMNVEAYKTQVHAALFQLEDLIVKINDLVAYRVEKNLKIIARTVLVDLPTDRSVTLDEFVSMQEHAVRDRTTALVAKNLEVETAVEDLIAMLRKFPLDPSVPVVADEVLGDLRSHYNRLTYQALSNCTRHSLNTIKMRVFSRSSSSNNSLINMIVSDQQQQQQPFFEVDIQLSVPSVRLSPSLDDVQRAINRAAVAVLGCSRSILEWGQLDLQVKEAEEEDDTPHVVLTSFFERLGCDREIIKVALLLTGALYATKESTKEYLVTFKKYDWLWKDDKDAQYRAFVARAGPMTKIADYEQELRQFMEVEEELEGLPNIHKVGALSLNAANLKLQLRNESRQWKVQYSTKVHLQARESVSALLEYIRVTTAKLQIEVNNLDSLRFVMTTLREIRERESSIEMELLPIFDMYQMLEHYLPGGLVDKEEMDRKSLIRPSWRKLMNFAEDVADTLSSIQGQYKKQLVHDVREFLGETRSFRADFEANGPQLPGISPGDAVERLRRYKDELQIRERKMEMYAAGEELFALRTTKFVELLRTRKEVGLLDQLYGLYLDVMASGEARRGVLWTEFTVESSKLTQMFEETAQFDARCRKMPKRLREWEAFTELRRMLNDSQEVLPLLAELSKPSIKSRHWLAVFEVIKCTLPYDKTDVFNLGHIFDSPILLHRGAVEEIADGADKQSGIEVKLSEIRAHWARNPLTFASWNKGPSRRENCSILAGFGQVLDDLEEAQLQLQTLLTMRHVAPFRDEVTTLLSRLSDTSDTLELWVKVQLLWTALESVFMGGDIAKQMPLEAKKFAKIDRDFVGKIMQKALETQTCVACCANELLRNTLPVLYAELEKCQKSLEGYLEQKRRTFPRFYFVSNPVLLLILSQGSGDPLRMQPYYEKVFDSVDKVQHNATSQIVGIKSTNGSSDEESILLKAALTAGSSSIEVWLGELVLSMQRSLKSLCETAARECTGVLPLREFVDSNCAQLALLGLQFNWTAQCTEALEKSKTSKTIVVETNKAQAAILQNLSAWCLQDLRTKLNRTKIETLVTIHLHQRDVFADLAKIFRDRKSLDPTDFEWLKQARFYWRNDGSDVHGAGQCQVSIADVDFDYCFEYLGCKERLVITPLTDRCFITLSQALGMHLGGAPAGPAGTGKTETVKDLGRALGIFVVVTNCTDQQRHTDMAKIFKGLCQAGLWGCFDEFNRIELPVLSVVAQQVLAITNAKRACSSTKKEEETGWCTTTKFAFPGGDNLNQLVTLDRNVGYFITMNPGYAGRQELPENLKVLFRSVAMMVPDREIIMKVKLCSVGYLNFADLAHKFNTLYRLCEQQLSRQKHYDFGLRNILSVLRTAGKTKRDNQQTEEGALLMRTLRDMNLSKFVAKDVPLFLTLLDDLFPSSSHVEMMIAKNEDMKTREETVLDAALTAALSKRRLVDHPSWRLKVLQLHETTLVRHGVMLVGPAGSGKTQITVTLQEALTRTTGIPHKRVRMNPKAITPEEMFGETERSSGEWLNGVFAAIWSKFNDRARNKDVVTWIVCDGPVDAVWIENLNTVLDDNKLLTLANGDRIPMTENVKLCFEVEDLKNASPATVSRAGVVFVSDVDLDWEPVLQAWLLEQQQGSHCAVLKEHLFRYLRGVPEEVEKPPVKKAPKSSSSSSSTTVNSTISSKPSLATAKNTRLRSVSSSSSKGLAFDFLASKCNVPLKTTRVGAIESVCSLLSALLADAELSESKADVSSELDRLVLFALSWGVAGLLDHEDRLKWDAWLREFDNNNNMPIIQTEDETFLTIFEFSVNRETMEWEQWAVPEFQSSISTTNWSTVLVPTVESARGAALMAFCQKQRRPVLIAGGSGTAKTSTALSYFESFEEQGMLLKKMNFSNATTPGMLQRAVEGDLDKQGGKNFGPPAGKSLTVFFDDLSMPEVNVWGDQATLELARQLVETSGVCFLDKDKRGDFKNIERLLYVAAMDLPGGGKNDIPNRLKRHFFAYTIPTTSDATVQSIYGTLLTARFLENNPEEFSTGSCLKLKNQTFFCGSLKRMPLSSLAMIKWARSHLLPSPSKFHYTFNLREISRLFQGILRTPRESFNSEQVIVQLWRHETERVLADKLVSLADKAALDAELDNCTQGLINPNYFVAIANSPSSPGTLEKPGSASVSSRSIRGGGSAKKGTNWRTSNNNKDPHHAASANKSPGLTSAPSAELAEECMNKVHFVDFLREDEYDEDGVLIKEAPKVYEAGPSLPLLRTKVETCLKNYNEANQARKMDLVIFDDALLHLLRVSRVLGMPRGNMMLVGVGGSGKQSLTHLAAHMAGHERFEICVTKTYNMNSFMDDLRTMYKTCGQLRKKATFVFTDAQIKDETFLELLNSFLATGEINGLFPKDELQIMASISEGAGSPVETNKNLVRTFFETVRANLHVVLCFSPKHLKFAERARKFPALMAGCTIDWFLAWPAEALEAVSEGHIRAMGHDLKAEEQTKKELVKHMAMVHSTTVECCEAYYAQTRRRVSQTPRSFLSYLRDYRKVYASKLGEIEQKSMRVYVGLEKLQGGSRDVEAMKGSLAEEEAKLGRAREATTLMLGKLQQSSLSAKKEADAVQLIKVACQADAQRIEGEKREAEKDLAKAQPFVDQAEQAVNSIKPADLTELKKLQKPSDVIRLIFDVVAILKQERLNKVELCEYQLGIGKEKSTFPFVRDSYKLIQAGMLSDARFLQNIFYFSKYEKDLINDETVELMQPYLDLAGFNPLVARNASKAAEGLCAWSRAMGSYHEASKIVKPKLEALRLAESRLSDAQRELDKAEQKLQACMDKLAGLQSDFEAQMATKQRIEAGTAATRRKMDQATALIGGLSGERERWTSDSLKFEEIKKALVGDVALGCAFVSYCGPFNQEYREYILRDRLTADLEQRNVPCTASLNVVDLLVQMGERGDWHLEGLPTDLLSVQNGILVTRSSRYPLLIDPQGQAVNWIGQHEKDRMPGFGTTTMGAPRLREHLEFAMAEGKALLVKGVEDSLDPLLDPVLNKQIVVKGKTKYICVAESKLCEFNPAFSLYLTTRLANPVFSPEDQAKTTVIDFSVTMKGLEEQLLGRVIQKEQRSLEEQLFSVLEEVATNTKALLRLDELLLERLSANSGSHLLDDDELIAVLAETKTKAVEVREKLVAAASTRESIHDKREQYRPAAVRGAVLYFSIVDMTQCNVMYQTSLSQFRALFESSMDLEAEKAPGQASISRRVVHVIETMTYVVYRAVNRGLYERDRLAFKLLLLFKILVTAGKLEPAQVTLFLKGGASLDGGPVKPKPTAWLSDQAWLHATALATAPCAPPIFRDLLDNLSRNEAAWRAWYADEEPDTLQVPTYESRFLEEEAGSGCFARLLLIRALREDRTISSVHDFIRRMDTFEDYDGVLKNLPCLGPRYLESEQETLEGIVYSATATATPVVFLLSPGADPTDSVETLARKRKKLVTCVSMGEGQEAVAMRAVKSATASGEWVLLQNAHLGLPFVDHLEELLNKTRREAQILGGAVHADFRLFLTTEPHPKFPIGLLQLAVKVTDAPPAGLQAGLTRTLTVLLDQDLLERIETHQWRSLIFSLAFLHSIVQERAKFGAVGWCVPYEFNDGDLNASFAFLERHLMSNMHRGPSEEEETTECAHEPAGLSWPTLQYMVAEVQYGGKITDDYDRRLFATYASAWLGPATSRPGFQFAPDAPLQAFPDAFKYAIPIIGKNLETHEELTAYVGTFPKVDSPELFGLHPNADLTFRNKQVGHLLETIIGTQPKQQTTTAKLPVNIDDEEPPVLLLVKTSEERVYEKCEEILGALFPKDYDNIIEETLVQSLDVSVPLNVFLGQEVERFQIVLTLVRSQLERLLQAIRGEVVITQDLIASISALEDSRPPKSWVFAPSGDEISWQSSTLGNWTTALADRDKQLRGWLERGKQPKAFWLSGFFNPTGFLTAVQQEVTRKRQASGDAHWALDTVELLAEVTEFTRLEQVPKAATSQDGVYAFGLCLDGAGWDRGSLSLCESTPKTLFCDLPFLHLSAVSKVSKAPKQDYGPLGGYSCPVYRYRARTDRHFIFAITLGSQHRGGPNHWILRGVALIANLN